MRTPFGVTGVEEAREKLLALTRQSSGLTAGLRGMEEAREALHRICDQHAEMGKLAGSFAGMHRLHDAAQATGRLGAQFAGKSAKFQEAVGNLTGSLNNAPGGMLSESALLGHTAASSQLLHDLVNRNYDLSSRLDDRIADLTADVPHEGLVNPIHETNEKLDHMIVMQVDLAKLHQNLNETTIAFLSDFRNVAQRTKRQTQVFMGLGFLTLIAAIVGTWLTFASSNDITSANQQMLESLADQIATIQSNMAAQSANERDAMLAEQRSLIQQLINHTQTLMGRQAIEQRKSIQDLRAVLSRTEAWSKAPTPTPRQPLK